jgi:hypothetical protein
MCRSFAALATFMALAGCSSPTAVPAPVARVSVVPDTASLQVGETRRLHATVLDAAGNALAGRTVAWSSSSESVAHVSQDGTVTAVAPGIATIAAASEGRSATATVTVALPLDAPAGVTVERRSRLRARVSWVAAAGADAYRVDRRAPGGDWATLGTTTAVQFTDTTHRARGATYEYRVTAMRGATGSPSSAVVSTVVPAIRIAMIGDSNLAWGKDGSVTVATSYISSGDLRIDPDDAPDHPKLLSGKVMALRPDVEALNHGISSTRTGTGTVSDRPNALHAIGGVTRFEAEVLGMGYPWTAGGVSRVNAFTPTPADFAYYSLGVNDIGAGVAPEVIRDNIGTAIDLWLGAGLPAAHLMVTTIGPRIGNPHVADIPATNRLIRALVAEKGASLIDVAALVSNDDGLTWKSSTLHTGDGLHYREAVNDMIAAEIVATMNRISAPALPTAQAVLAAPPR